MIFLLSWDFFHSLLLLSADFRKTELGSAVAKGNAVCYCSYSHSKGRETMKGMSFEEANLFAGRQQTEWLLSLLDTAPLAVSGDSDCDMQECAGSLGQELLTWGTVASAHIEPAAQDFFLRISFTASLAHFLQVMYGLRGMVCSYLEN